jgi:acetoin utilization deacetylase AcuC-like enzyme
MRTGIFFYHQKGERLRDFPKVLEGILEKEDVFFYDAFYPTKIPSSFELERISPETLLQIHTVELIEEVKGMGIFEGALLSASGTVRAAEKIWRGEIDRAFVFTGYGDHHAGTSFFYGGCYFNGAAIAIDVLRRNFGAKRFAIIDTDAHHGDGTWEIFEDDPNVLYMCLCGSPSLEKNNKINIQVPPKVLDEEYLELIRIGLLPRTKSFQPDLLFWNWGYDGTRGEYGDIGLTPDLHISLAKELKALANEISNGRLIIVLCGGSGRDLAHQLIPQIIRVLIENESASPKNHLSHDRLCDT